MRNWLDDSQAHGRSTRSLRVGILLIPPFALLPYASAVEPMRAANDLTGKKLFDWVHVAPRDNQARASNGVVIPTEHTVADTLALDFLLVCAGTGIERFRDRRTLAWIRSVARSGIPICGISDGVHILARAGVLDGYRVTTHWDSAAGFQIEYPDIQVTTEVYVIDRNRVTCSGGITPIDMMHELIKRLHGPRLAAEISDWFQHATVRPGNEATRMHIKDRTGAYDGRVIAAIEYLENNLEDRVSVASVAAVAGVSSRQLERLFVRNVGFSVASYCMMARLRRARELLSQTSMSVLEIALATGFTSASHFSRSYKRLFGTSPAGDRC